MRSNRSGFSKSTSHASLKTKPKAAHSPADQPFPTSPSESKTETDASDPALALKARDALIEDLRKRVLQLSAQAKRLDLDSVAAREKQVKTLLEEKAALAKQLKAAESLSAELQTKLQASDSAVQQKAESQRQEADRLTEENAKLHAQLSEQTMQLQSAKADISQMSGIVQDMTSLNSELNEKILKLNQEMETTNATAFEASAKAQQYEELAKELAEAQEKTRAVEEERGMLRTEVDTVKGQLKNALGVIAAVAEELQAVDREEVRKAVDALKAVPAFSPPPRPPNTDPVSSLNSQLAHLKAELKAEKHESARICKIDSVQRTRITALEGEKAKMKAEMTYVLEKQKKQIALLKEQLGKAMDKEQETADTLRRVAADSQAAHVSIAHLTDRVNSLKSQLAEGKKSEDALKSTVATLKSNLIDAQIDRTAYESSLALREATAKDASSRLTALMEELWKRDNEIIRKEAQRLKLQNDFNALKASLESSHVTFKLKMSEEMTRASLKLDAKEQEMNELKKMLLQSTSPTQKKARSNLGKIEDTWRQLTILNDRAKNGSGEAADRQIIDNLRTRGITAVDALERELSPDTVITLQDAQSYPLLKESMKAAASVTVQEVLADMKAFISRS